MEKPLEEEYDAQESLLGPGEEIMSTEESAEDLSETSTIYESAGDEIISTEESPEDLAETSTIYESADEEFISTSTEESPEDSLETSTIYESAESNEIILVEDSTEELTRPRQAEIDERRITIEDYLGRTTPINIQSAHNLDTPIRGGWIAALFIIGIEIAERVAYYGLSANMAVYIFSIMHQTFSKSANAVNMFVAVSQASLIIWSVVADEYLGQFWTIAISAAICFVGLTGLTVCSIATILMPRQEFCDQISLGAGNCRKGTTYQMLFLYVFLYIAAFGAAGIKAIASSLRADQFDESRREKMSQFDHLCNAIAGILVFAIILLVQLAYGWRWVFGSFVLIMCISDILLFAGKPLYKQKLPGGSPLKNVAQVLVAAIRKRSASFSSSETRRLYGGHMAITDDLRCLNKAALQEDGIDPNAWRLCTITQVEEAKIVLKLLPITTCTIILSVILTESLTLTIQQAFTLNTQIRGIKVPVNCLNVLPTLMNFLILILHYYLFVPLIRHFTSHPNGVSTLQRIGIGLGASVLSIACTGIFETYRRNFSIEHHYKVYFLTSMPNLSAYWLLIQLSLGSLAEVFGLVLGLQKFIEEEVPNSMKEISVAFNSFVWIFGGFGATILNIFFSSIIVDEENRSWLTKNINVGRLDYLCYFLTGLSAIIFCGFLYLAKNYKYRVQHG